MNREILFRGKRFDNGKWVYGIPLFDWATCSLKCENQHNGDLCTFFGWNDGCHEYDEFEIDPATVGQYTGLTDKNGVKIFEGDILQEEPYYNGNPPHLLEGSVCLAEGSFCVGEELLSQYLFNSKNGNCSLHDITVIGNIHDNPELLQEV